MVQQFLKIQTQLSGVDELLLLLPHHLYITYLTNAFESLKQREMMSYVESQEVFYLFLKDIPAFAFYIGKDALIVENKLF
jgi:hypothetical protein